MNMKSILAVAVMATGAFCASAQASPVWTVSAQGTIAFGSDFAGIFGTAGQSLAGLQYTQTITSSVDPAQYGYASAGPNSVVMYGSAPGFTQTFTVNGKTVSYTVAQSTRGEQVLSNEATQGGLDMVRSHQYGNDADGNRIDAQINAETTNPADAFVPGIDFSQKAVVDVTKASTFGWFSVGNQWGGFDVFAGTSIDTLSINVSDVPEPASLGLVGLGFAGIAALRRRRKVS